MVIYRYQWKHQASLEFIVNIGKNRLYSYTKLVILVPVTPVCWRRQRGGGEVAVIVQYW